MLRSNRRGRRTWLLVALVLALVVQWYVLTTLHEREVAQVEAKLLARASATITALEQQPTLTPVPTATPAPRMPADAVELALNAVLDFMKNPRQPSPSLEELTDSGFISPFQRQIDHLTDGGLRLSPRSSYELLSVELALEDEHVAELLTHERWVYDEETVEGEPVRCLVETSVQRYRLMLRDGVWVVTDLTLEGTPTREPCAPESDATAHPPQGASEVTASAKYVERLFAARLANQARQDWERWSEDSEPAALSVKRTTTGTTSSPI